jgi:hypothetical protein
VSDGICMGQALRLLTYSFIMILCPIYLLVLNLVWFVVELSHVCVLVTHAMHGISLVKLYVA